MKILALRGENLASLQSRFDIDFSGSRLGDAGLFAITGKTGAGKSTLLDAICLSLYGSIPRLQANKKNDAEIGRDDDENRIKANDVRSILSRGKGEAFAEVDFLADDGTRWCAHWSVRRARSKAEGRIQAAEQWLENLNTSQRFAGKKQELQGEIQRLIGLSFEQFRRAVMLPQGEFAAFLKAPTHERAELLERMTGGEIYSRLSVLAHERARVEKASYQQLQSKLGDVVLLSDEEKQAVHQQTAQLKQQSAALSARLTELKQHQDVLATHEKLQLRVSTAQTSAEAAEQKLTTAEPRRQHLALLEKVQPVRSDFSLLRQARTQLANLQQTLNTSLAELPTIEQTKQALDAQANSASESLQKTLQDWKTLEPDLRAALKLEQQLKGLQQQLDEQKQEQQAQLQSAQEQEKTLAALKSQQAELQQRQQMLKEKLTQDQTGQLIAEHYDSVCDNLEQYTAAQQAQAQLQADKQTITDEQLAHEKQRDVLVTQLDKLAGKKAGYESQIAQTDLAALEQLQQQALSQYADKQQFRDLLHQAMATLKEWLSVLAQAEKPQAQQSRSQQSLDDMQQDLQRLLPELDALKIRHAECEQLVQKSREVMQLSDYRAELRPDEACPLCGSPDHPYAVENPLANNLLQTQQQRLRELADDLKKHDARRIQLEQSIPKEQEQLSVTQADSDDLRQQVSVIYQRYAVLFDSLRLTETLHEESGKHVLEQQLASWETEVTQSAETLAGLKHSNEQRAQQIKLSREVQDQLLQLREQEHALNTQRHALAQQSTQWQERLQSLDTQYKVQDAILRARANALQTQFAGDSWQQSLQELGKSAFIARLDGQTQQYQQDQQALSDAAQQYTALAPKMAATREALDHIRTQSARQAARLNELTEQSQHLKQQRETLVAEQDLAALESKHQQAIETAQTRLATAQKAQGDAAEKLAAFKATIAGMQQQQAEADTKLQQLNQHWTDWQQKLALDETQLSELLAHDEEWLTAERAALKTIDQAAASAQVALTARQQDLLEQEVLLATSQQWLADHGVAVDQAAADETGADEAAVNKVTEGKVADATTLQNQLAQDWQQQKDELEEQIFQYRQQLSVDEQARSKAGSLTTQLTAQQERHELWETMNELIGSANGSKFRSLAQSLTLQQLVILANEHLQDLAPRYALQPVPGSGLALQVIDHDMGDEVRSVESLSGGESFLVSLALALALASLAADTRQLGSLFIDEGFGTLDPDSLEMALACLDALQAEGRQIGVISHVSTLVERIGVQIKVEATGGGQSRVLVSE